MERKGRKGRRKGYVKCTYFVCFIQSYDSANVELLLQEHAKIDLKKRAGRADIEKMTAEIEDGEPPGNRFPVVTLFALSVDSPCFCFFFNEFLKKIET